MIDGSASRRSVLAGGAAMAALALVAVTRSAGAVDLADAERALIGDRVPVDGGILLKLPEQAENGVQVPLTVSVDSPMTPDSHVRAIHLVATRNPTPGVASYRFSPRSGRAQVTTRVRIAEGQTLVALAEMSDGTVRRTTAEVRVAVGGCII